jgi:hypothetical protein
VQIRRFETKRGPRLKRLLEPFLLIGRLAPLEVPPVVEVQFMGSFAMTNAAMTKTIRNLLIGDAATD